MALSPEELEAKIKQEAGKDIPADVLNDFRMVIIAAKAGRLSLFKQMCPETGRIYYMLVTGDTDPIARAVIPERISAGQFVSNYDSWMDKAGASCEMDPDYKGVKQ